MNGTANGAAGAMNGAAVMAAPLPDLTALPEAPASVTVKLAYRGRDVMLTLRGLDGRSVLGRLDAALDWLEQHGATPATSTTTSAGPAAAAVDQVAAPTCPTHGRPMKQGKRGGWYCPAKLADDDGTGRPLYCRARAGGS